MKNTIKALWSMIQMMLAYIVAVLAMAIGIPGRLLWDVSNELDDVRDRLIMHAWKDYPSVEATTED